MRGKNPNRRPDGRRSGNSPTDPDARDGSNAWVLAPRLTLTGRPILANDPHLRIGVPSVRWMSHLSAPGIDVIGAGYPGNPGIQNGHDARVAFGRTDFSIGDEDVYVLETKPDDPNQYLYDGEWRPFQIVSETIDVAEAPPVQVQLKYSAFGPIVSESPSSQKAIAVRLTAMEPGAATGLQYLESNFSTDWTDFSKAIQSEVFGTNYLTPTWTVISAGVQRDSCRSGPITTACCLCQRSADTLGAGCCPRVCSPSEFDPERGNVASSNQMPFPPDYPYAERKVGFEWVGPTRYNRVVQMLKAGSNFSLADMIAMQHDVWLA